MTICLLKTMKLTLASIATVLTDKTSIANFGALLVVNFTTIEMVVKIIVGLSTVVWTVLRIKSELQNMKDRNANESSDISNKDIKK